MRTIPPPEELVVSPCAPGIGGLLLATTRLLCRSSSSGVSVVAISFRSWAADLWQPLGVGVSTQALSIWRGPGSVPSPPGE